MTNRSLARALLVLIILILGGSLLLSSAGCDPTIRLNLENQSAKTLDVYINQKLLGKVDEMGEKTFSTLLIPYKSNTPWAPASGKYLIEAKTLERETVYSKEFTWQELDDMKWKIVISP